MKKVKTGSSSSDDSDSSGSEECDNGLVPKQHKKTSTNKDLKKAHSQAMGSAGGPVPPPLVQSRLFAPPVSDPCSALESPQMLAPGYDLLAHFMNPHLTQSNSEHHPAFTNVGPHISSGLMNAVTANSQMPTETHSYLNQQPITPSPAIHNALPQQPSRPSNRAAPLPPKLPHPPPPHLLPLSSTSPQLPASMPLNLPQPIPRARVPSPPSHGILGMLSAQPPQALLEDDEETPPLSQVHTFLQSLQARPVTQSQPPHMHSPPQGAPNPALTQRHGSGHGPMQPLTHSSAAPNQKGLALQQKASHVHQPLPSPHSKTERYSTGCLRGSPSPLMTHSPQRPQFNTVGQQSPAQTKRHELRSNLVNIKDEKRHSPVLPPSSFSPALRQDSHKALDSRHRIDLKPPDGSRPVPQFPDSPRRTFPQQDKIKQEAKTPIVTKKTPDVKLKNMGSWASLAQRSQSMPASSVRSSSDSFEQFKRAAREKEERERQLKAQAEQAKREQEKQRRDDEDSVDQARRLHDEVRRRQEQQSPHAPTPPALTSPTNSPQAPPTQPQAPPSLATQNALDQQRELARRREQERRRREAMADTIDINFQSDLMAIFEENLF